MSDDITEFLSQAVKEAPYANQQAPRRRRRPRDSDEEEKPGELTQYTIQGSGYIPTTSTVQTLPSDCYKIAYTPNGIPFLQPQNLITDQLMRLPDSRSDEVVKEVETFWTLKDTFKKYGFSHKRGFLLWGPPGSGKTSTVAMIVKHMIERNGIIILGEAPTSLSTILQAFRSIEPERPLVVIWEDIDTVIQEYGESEVLSILDGESQIENVVFIATTNYPENLDGRVINRPSRFDRIVKIDTPNDEARALYLNTKIGITKIKEKKLDDKTKELIEIEYDLVKETKGLSIAHIKEFIVSVYCQQNTVWETLERLQRMRYVPTSNDSKGPLGLR